MKKIEGMIVANGAKIGIVAASFNEFIVSKLVSGAEDALLCNEVSKGIASVSLESGIPVMFGVVTTENIEQAIERAGTKAGNKGYDCAMGALEMIDLMKQL